MLKGLFKRKTASDNAQNLNGDKSDFRQLTKPDFKTFDALLEQHAALSFEKQLNFGEVIGSNNWQFDMNKGEITFGDNLSFPVQVIGSLSFNDNSWMWGWANSKSGIPDKLLLQSNELKRLGEMLQIQKLKEAHYAVSSGFEHIIGMIACGYFNTDGYYCANYGQGTLVVTIQSSMIPKINKKDTVKVLTVFPQLISSNEINHKESFKNYLIDRGFLIEESDSEIKGSIDETVIIATFDTLNRLIKLDEKV